MFSHEKLQVYQSSLEFAAWAYQLSIRLERFDRHARDQLIRASQSIPLNIAEGNGRKTSPDRARFFSIAYGSSLECAAILDILQVCSAISSDESLSGKMILDRIVAMLIGMIRRFNGVIEPSINYMASIEDGSERESGIEIESESEKR